MRQKSGRCVAALLAALVLCLPGYAQQEQKKYKAASLDGTVGLFKVWDAEALRKGEIVASLGFSHWNRDPGQLVIKTIPAAFAIGLHDRVELFGAVDLQRRVTSYQFRTYRVWPGQVPLPSQLRSGAVSFGNDAPFMDVQRGMGLGDVRLGAKINIFSEHRGSKFGMAGVAFAKVPTNDELTYLNRGLGTGRVDGGYGLLFSKRAGRIAQLHLNTLVNYVGNPRIGVNELSLPAVGRRNSLQLADLQNVFIYRAGAAWPTYGSFQLITEVEGNAYFGTKTAGLNPRSPLDLIIGMRGYLTDFMAAGLGYRATLNRVEQNVAGGVYPASTHGWVGQLALGRFRNDPPSITCSIANSSIKQDETTAVRASGIDPEGGRLVYTWSSSGGRITGSGDSVVFDATGVAPGEYTITPTVSDGKNSSSCTTRVTVIKKNLAPTVTCSPASATITQGESTTVRADGRDPNNDSLKYSWTVNGQALAADTPTVNFGTTGRAPGTYTVAVTVTDGEFSASCSSSVTVREAVKPNRPPTIECLTSSVDVLAGGSVELRARASDPDQDRTTITWSVPAGSISGTGESVTLNSTGMRAGTFTVTATVEDGRGGKASCTSTINVSERMLLASDKGGRFRQGSARLDNVAKAMLDDLAVRLNNEPRLRANIVGYTDDSRLESRGKLGGKRAKAASAYLKKKGVDISRVAETDGGSNNPIGDNKTSAGRAANRRIEVELTVR